MICCLCLLEKAKVPLLVEGNRHKIADDLNSVFKLRWYQIKSRAGHIDLSHLVRRYTNDNAGLCTVRLTGEFDSGLQCLLVRIQNDGHFCCADGSGGQRVDIGKLGVHFVIKASGGKVCLSHAVWIAVGSIRQVKHTQRAETRAAGHTGNIVATDQIAVETGAGNILAHFHHNEHIGFIHIKTGHQFVCALEKLRLLCQDFVLLEHMYLCQVAKSVLYSTDSANNVELGECDTANGENILRHIFKAEDMRHFRALLLGKADCGHLGNAAFDGATEGGVALDAVEQDNTVTFVGIFVNVHRQATVAGTDFDDLHRRKNGRAHSLLGNAVVMQYFALSFSGGAAMAAHSRDQNGLATLGFDIVRCRLNKQGILVNAAAAAGDGDALAGLNVKVSVDELLHQDLIYIGKIQIIKFLPDLNDFGQFNGSKNLFNFCHTFHSRAHSSHCSEQPAARTPFLFSGFSITGKQFFKSLEGILFIGIAFILAVLESDSIAHPPIEAVFTTNEETDMSGAKALHYDFLKSRIILSLDAARLSLGGAGELDIELRADAEWVETPPENRQAVIALSGLLGGHSGKNAMAERGNAVTLLARMLAEIQEEIPFQLISFAGGSETACAFARDAACTISFPAEEREHIIAAVERWNHIYRNELAIPDPDIRLSYHDEEKLSSWCCSAETADRLLTLLTILPDGLCSIHKHFPMKYETCVNVGVVEMERESFRVLVCVRSAVASKKAYQAARIRRVCKLLQVQYRELCDLPQWDYSDTGPLARCLQNIYGANHVGITEGTCEQGIFQAHMQGAKAFGVGPVVHSPHSPNEHISIRETAKDWERFLKVLSAIDSNMTGEKR